MSFGATSYSVQAHAVQEKAETVAARPPASANVFVDSRQREGQPINSFSIRNEIFRSAVSWVQPVSFRWNWNIPNVNPANNTLFVWVAGVITAYTIPSGYYDATSIAAAIQSATGGFLTVVYETIALTGNRLRITSATPFRLLADPAGGLSILDVIGVRPMATAATLVYSRAPPPMLYTRYFDVVSDSMHADSILRDEVSDETHSSVLIRIWSADPAPHVIDRELRNPKTIYVNPHRILNFCEFRLLDERGKALYVPADSDDFTLRFIVGA
jgi:hypothetical protein